MDFRLAGLGLLMLLVGAVALSPVLPTHVVVEEWIPQTSSTSQDLRSIDFVDKETGWAIGRGGTIIKTANGGLAWSIQTSGTSSELWDLTAIDRLNVWVVGAGGAIRRTSNGGGTWGGQSSGTTNTLFGLDMIDSSSGWAVGARGTILRTNDAGSSWTAQTSGTTRSLFGVDFVDRLNGWTVGAAGTILKTANGGISWIPQANIQWPLQTLGLALQDRTLLAVAFVDSSNGWAIGVLGTILRTTDGGSTWRAQNSGVTRNLNGIRFLTGNDGWVVGDANTILRTTNGGSTWEIMQGGVGPNLNSIDFVLEEVLGGTAPFGWTVGVSGAILHLSKFDFELLVSPSSRLVGQSGDVVFGLTLTLVDPGSVTDLVFLSVSGLPSATAATFNPSTGRPDFTSTLTVTTSSSTSLGTFTLTITAQTATLTRTASVQLRVSTSSDLQVVVSPAKLELSLGSSGSSTVILRPFEGFNEKVTLSISGLPTGVSAAFSNTEVTPPQGSILSLNVVTTAVPGTSSLTVAARTDAGVVRTDILVLKLTTVFDFALLFTSSASVTVEPGQSATYDLSVGVITGIAQPVSLAISGLPAGATAGLSSSGGSPPFTSTITVSAGAGLARGTYSMSVTGTGGGVTRRTSFTLVVASAQDFTLTVSPNRIAVRQDKSAIYRVDVRFGSGTPQIVFLGIGGLPENVFVSFTPAQGVPSFNTQLNVTTTLETPKGDFTLSVTSTDLRGTSRSLAVTLTVQAGTGGGGCLIATATYGSELSSEVAILRTFRDGTVLESFSGRQFMNSFDAWYYSFSPLMAEQISFSEEVRDVSKIILYPLIGVLQASSKITSMLSSGLELRVFLTGGIASLLLGLVYVTPIAFLLPVSCTRKKNISRISKRLGVIWLSAVIVMVFSILTASSGLIHIASLAFVVVTLTMPSMLLRLKFREFRQAA